MGVIQWLHEWITTMIAAPNSYDCLYVRFYTLRWTMIAPVFTIACDQ